MPRLQILNGKRQGSVFDLADGGELVIGHRATASVAIDDPWVSWDHARIYFQGRDCHIEDLGSTNGTYVNCVRVKHEELRHEDIIFLGKTHVLFLAPSTSDLDSFLVDDSVDEFGGSALLSGLGSEHGPFNSGSGSPPLVDLPLDPFRAPASGGGPGGFGGQDPFAGAGGGFAGAARDPFAVAASGTGQHDPFASGGVDPFSSGPDYSDVQTAFVPTPPPFPAPAGLGPGGTPLRRGDPRGRGDLALSHSYEEPGAGLDPRQAPGPRSISNPFSDDPINSGVLSVNYGGGFEPNSLSTPTHGLPIPPAAFEGAHAQTLAERSPFAETRGDESLSPLSPEPQRKASRSLSLSQLDDDGEPELPAPSPAEIADLLDNSGRRKRGQMSGSDLGLSDELDRIPESEMRTREIDTNDVAAILAEHEGLNLAAAAGKLPVIPQQLGIESTHADILAGVAAEQGEAGLAIYEAARLQAENQRLRLAIQAAQQQNPQAVQAAAQFFRDQELVRLGQQVAELQRQAADLRATLAAREHELNEVTEDMIEKEDRIDQLEGELRDQR